MANSTITKPSGYSFYFQQYQTITASTNSLESANLAVPSGITPKTLIIIKRGKSNNTDKTLSDIYFVQFSDGNAQVKFTAPQAGDYKVDLIWVY